MMFPKGIESDISCDSNSRTLQEFAIANHITEDRVWELLEEGDISARFVNEDILVYRPEGREVLDCFDPPSKDEGVQKVQDPEIIGAVRDLGDFKQSRQNDNSSLKSFRFLSFSKNPSLHTLSLYRENLKSKSLIIELQSRELNELRRKVQEHKDLIIELTKEVEDLRTLKLFSNRKSR